MLAVLYYVLRTPGCYSKLQRELDTHLQPASPAAESTYFETPYSQARELPYLHACIQEAFRMCPALGSMLERIVPSSGATICGVPIPGGTIVGCNAWVVQRDKKTFGEDCDTYRPERWLADAETTRNMERSMFQFGGGSHICLGQYIALMEIYKLVPSLIKTYEVRFLQSHHYGKCGMADYVVDFSCGPLPRMEDHSRCECEADGCPCSYEEKKQYLKAYDRHASTLLDSLPIT